MGLLGCSFGSLLIQAHAAPGSSVLMGARVKTPLSVSETGLFSAMQLVGSCKPAGTLPAPIGHA